MTTNFTGGMTVSRQFLNSGSKILLLKLSASSITFFHLLLYGDLTLSFRFIISQSKSALYKQTCTQTSTNAHMDHHRIQETRPLMNRPGVCAASHGGLFRSNGRVRTLCLNAFFCIGQLMKVMEEYWKRAYFEGKGFVSTEKADMKVLPQWSRTVLKQ